MKSYQLFQIYKRFDKETEKTLLQQSMRKEELIKVRLCFIIGCFIRSFKMIILSFCFTCSFAVYFLLFDISMTQKIEKREIRNGELLGMTNYKNNFNILGRNLTQKKFLYWQNMHTWHLIKVNHERSLQFVVVPTLISWSKTKIFTNYHDKIY